jgi:hypothetical protein
VNNFSLKAGKTENKIFQALISLDAAGHVFFQVYKFQIHLELEPEISL